MKRSKLSIISFILTTLIIVSSIPVSSVADGECHFDDTSSYPVSQKSDYSYVDDIVSEEIAEEYADELSCRITDYVDKAQFESQNYAFRVEQDESLNTYVFQKEDGKRVVYYLDENVKFIDDNGEVKEKNLSLTSTEKGFSPACNDIDILLPTTIKESIQFNHGKFSIAITPSGNNFAEGKSDGKSVSYTEVFGENTILRYTPLLSGIKEDIIVTDRTAPAEYSFILKTNGLFVHTDENGFYLSPNLQSEERIRLGNVVAYDAEGHESIGYLLVNTVSEGSEYVVTVSIDSDFLVNESTVFPVTIDPTFIVSDNTHGSNAIQDAPIFQNKSSINFGTFLYDRVGILDNNYGVGRTVVKLSGFTSATEYTTITASQIDSVLFYAKESSGGNTQTINLHPITGVSTWTENTVTWNTIGSSFDTSVNFGTTMYNNEWSSFDITNLVKGWKTGAYTADCGFILKNSNESNNKCFDSCECSTTGNRPYVVMTYTPTISLNYSTLNIEEGSNSLIVASTQPSGISVSWTSSNSSIASVSSSGTVTGIKAGITQITASITVDGYPYHAYCTVYVYLPNGVYYFDNHYKNNRIEFYGNNSYNENDELTGYETDFTAPSLPDGRYQLFKVYYHGSGLYSIRSMIDNSMGWYRLDSLLVSRNIGTSNSSVPNAAKWYIGSNTNGYYIYSQYGTIRTVTCPENFEEDWNIVLSTYSSTNTLQAWSANRITSNYRGITIKNKKSSMNIGESFTFTAITYSTYQSEYSFTVKWRSGNGRIAYAGPNSGSVTALNHGKIDITAYLYSYPSVTSVCTLTVGTPSSATTGINSGSVYMIKNISKGLYLKATSVNSFTLASKDVMDGKQLWYVEWTGSGYKLYSMGIKISNGTNEAMLRGNTPGNSPILQTSLSDKNWSISYSSGYYYLVSTSTSYNGASLSAESSGSYVKCIDLDLETEYARWEFEEINTSTFNNYWTGSYSGQGSTVYVKIVIDNSGTDSVYFNSIISSTDFDVINQWKNKSSHLVVYGPSDTVPSGITPFEIHFKGYSPSGTIIIDGVSYPAVECKCGETNGYKKTLFGESITTLGNDWNSVRISLNTNTSGPLNGDTELIRTTIIHEMGHALKLAHPKHSDYIATVLNGRGAYLDDNCVCAVMNQDSPSNGLLTCATPKWHDIINLKNKWGD